jgi:hypothetical protein
VTSTLPPRTAREELERIDTKAACGSGRHNPDLWHSVLIEEIDHAKAVCRVECPVMARCLAWALATGQDHGVWGGLSKRDRDALGKSSPRVVGDTGGPVSVSPRSKIRRLPCRVCGRPIGLDLAGRTSKHADVTTKSTCTGSWTTPEGVKA